MRDRETDSWWSIMKGEAIGGRLQGTPLRELPVGEKTTWGDWVRRHPDTLVLSVDGREHDPRDPYRSYFASERAFRDLQIDDHRLPPKAPVYGFRLAGVPYAVSHAKLVGGALFDLGPDDGQAAYQVWFFREAGASLFASTHAFRIPRGLLRQRDGVWWLEQTKAPDSGSEPRLDTLQSLDALEAIPGVEKLSGFDTYWYTWIAVNKDSRLLQ